MAADYGTGQADLLLLLLLVPGLLLLGAGLALLALELCAGALVERGLGRK